MTKLFRMVSKNIIDEIYSLRDRLDRTEGYSLMKKRKRSQALQREAARHSVEIEFPGDHSKRKQDSAKIIKKYEAFLLEALDLGARAYSGKLDASFILELGRMIDPFHNRSGFRNVDVRVTGNPLPPPPAHRVRYEMDDFLIQNDCLREPIDKALHAHFNLARIHPFQDGNGRISRLVQNIILDNSGFFPISLGMIERPEYIRKIQKAVYSYAMKEGNYNIRSNPEYLEYHEALLRGDLSGGERGFYCKRLFDLSNLLMTPEQSDFYNFLALKIRDSLQGELSSLEKFSRNGKKR